MKPEYKIVEGKTLVQLQDAVSQAIYYGWQLLEGSGIVTYEVYTVYNLGTPAEYTAPERVFIREMVRYEIAIDTALLDSQ